MIHFRCFARKQHPYTFLTTLKHLKKLTENFLDATYEKSHVCNSDIPFEKMLVSGRVNSNYTVSFTGSKIRHSSPHCICTVLEQSCYSDGFQRHQWKNPEVTTQCKTQPGKLGKEESNPAV